MKLTGLDPTISHTVTIEWDTTKAGNHAFDYLGTFNRTEGNANPCTEKNGSNTVTIPGCSYTPANATDLLTYDPFTGLGGLGAGTYDQAQIPVDPNIGGFLQQRGAFTMFGGDITAVSNYTRTGSYSDDSKTRITITFTVASSSAVFTWGGHIARRLDWPGGAVEINGSSFHTRLIELDGQGGSQDLQASAAAVIFPSSITIRKDARPNTSQLFDFVATGTGVTNFSLTDDGGADAVPSFKAFTG
jgi:hypothetical protein